MRKKTLIYMLLGQLKIWKGAIDSAHSTLCPKSLCYFVHSCPNYCLYEPMDSDRVCYRVSLHQGKFQQFSDGIIQLERVYRDSLENRTEFSSTFADDLFWYCIRVKKCTQTQQFGSSGICLLYLLK